MLRYTPKVLTGSSNQVPSAAQET